MQAIKFKDIRINVDKIIRYSIREADSISIRRLEITCEDGTYLFDHTTIDLDNTIEYMDNHFLKYRT